MAVVRRHNGVSRHRCCASIVRIALVACSVSPLIVMLHWDSAGAFAPPFARGRPLCVAPGRSSFPTLNVLKEPPEATPAAARKATVTPGTSMRNGLKPASQFKNPRSSSNNNNRGRQTQQQEDPNADQRYQASDWWQIIRSLPRSSILRTTRGPVLAVMVWSGFLSALHSGLSYAGYPAVAQTLTCAIPSTLPHAATVTALGLLLVFRTTSAYQKFDEGRHIWEHILSVSRNLTRMIYLYPEFSVERRHRIFQLLAAYPYFLHRHVKPSYTGEVVEEVMTRKGSLRNTASLAQRLLAILSGLRRNNNNKNNSRPTLSNASATDKRVGAGYVDRHALPWSMFPDKTVRLVAKSSNRPLWACDRMAQEVLQVPYSGAYTNMERSQFLLYIGQLSEAVGECERIHRTTVPLNYARHSLRGLTMWLVTLPLALMKTYGWWTAPVMGLAAWLLYGIYQIGYSIEDPFQGSLRLATLCDSIFRDVMCDARRATAFSVSMGEYEEWKDLPL